jgi:hypothetical protein
MGEDLVDHRWIFNAYPDPDEGAAMIFKAPPQLGQCSISMSKTRFSQLGPVHARRLSLGIAVIG